MARGLAAASSSLLLGAGLASAIPAEPRDAAKFELVLPGLDRPVFVSHAGGDRLHVAPFLDFAWRARSGGEQGATGSRIEQQ